MDQDAGAAAPKKSVRIGDEAVVFTWPTTILVSLVVLAPIPFGSNRAIWWNLIALITAGLLAHLAYVRYREPAASSVAMSKMGAIVFPFLLAVLWGFSQTLSFVPEAWGHPIWSLTSAVLGDNVATYISINPSASISGVSRLLAYGAVFWLAVQLCRDQATANRILKIIVIASILYAAYGLIMNLFGWERILWFRKWAYEGYLTSTFVNRNSYATFAGMGLVCTVAMLIHQLSGVLRMKSDWRSKSRILVEMLTGPAAYLVVGAIVIATAILLTGSRAGAFSTLCGIIVLSVACGFTRMLLPYHAAALIGASMLTGLLLFVFSGEALVERFDELEESINGRQEVYNLTLEAAQASPMTGTGLGTFPEVYTIFRDERLHSSIPFIDAHNTYLENALELGFPATILILLSFGSIVELLIYGIMRRRRARIYAPIGLGIITIAGVHSLVDFSLEIPAVTVFCMFLIGLACAQSFSSRRRWRGKGQRRNSRSTKPRRSPTARPSVSG